ncbi:MAG TPA: bifunctional UDP-sugar hydrolase/5'-nucleotidase [Candidatus Eisenbacteria bacterium]|nr:bifunctional UDP-sugar hydrolase/5'-nucleotidase [Candidatus Eisenbacteria bacterium]
MEKAAKVKENRAIARAARRAFRTLGTLAVGAMLLGFAEFGTPARAVGGGSGAAPRSVDSLVVLHTNDVHSHLDPFPTKGGEMAGGAAARAVLIAKEKARGGRVLLLDAGDLVQGTPYYNQFRGEPDHKILDLLGYDAIALGNHDLDDGVAAWRARAAVTRTPIVSANVFTDSRAGSGERRDSAGWVPTPASIARTARWVGGGKVPAGTWLTNLTRPYVILERGGLKIAILGLTTYSLDRIVGAAKNQGVAVGNPIETARYWVPRLRKEADLVIALSHLGVDEDRRLVEQVPGINLVIGGHTHTVLFRPILESTDFGHPAPIAQAGSWGRYLGRTTLRWSGERLTSASGRLIEVHPADGEDASIESVVASYRSRLSTDLERVVFRSPARVEMAGLNSVDQPLGNFVSDVIRDRTGADIAFMNGGGIRAPLPAGDVRASDILSMLPFDNHLVIVAMTGAQVRRLLDRMSPRMGKSGFGHVSGLSYVISRDRAVEVRIWDKGLNAGTWRGRSGGPGEPIDGNRVYRVGTIDFLASGGGYYDEIRDAKAKETTDILLSDAAIDFLRAHPDYKFAKDGRAQWRGGGVMVR